MGSCVVLYQIFSFSMVLSPLKTWMFRVSVDLLSFRSYQNPANDAEFQETPVELTLPLKSAVAFATVPLISTVVTVTALAGNATTNNINTANATAIIFLVIISLPPYFLYGFIFSFEICRFTARVI